MGDMFHSLRLTSAVMFVSVKGGPSELCMHLVRQFSRPTHSNYAWLPHVYAGYMQRAMQLAFFFFFQLERQCPSAEKFHLCDGQL